MSMPVNLQLLQHAQNATKTEKKNIFNRLVRCQEFKIISIRLEIRNQHVEMHQIPSMKEKSATSSAKPVSLIYVGAKCGRPHRGSNRAFTTGANVEVPCF